MCPLDSTEQNPGEGFADLSREAGSQTGKETVSGASTVDSRGQMYRAKRLMSDEDAKAFLHTHKVAHVGTVDAKGWPYVIPLIYIYEQGDRLYLHTGDHQGHFLTNIQHNPRICVEVGEIGAVHRGKPYACNSALVYSSVIVFGAVRLIDDRALKTWFFDRIMAKYGEEGWTFEPGYPQLNRIILYEQKMEIVTGKHSPGLYH